MKNDLIKLYRLLSTEEEKTNFLNNTLESKKLKETRAELLQYVCEIARGKDLTLIVATERTFVQGDLDRYSDGASNMRSSLTTALEQFDAIERLIGIIDDSQKYAEVDKDYSLRSSRKTKGGLPNDEARQSFKSHYTRLNNMTKGRVDNDERQVIEARKTAIFEAEKRYAEKQTKALGIALEQKRGN